MTVAELIATRHRDSDPDFRPIIGRAHRRSDRQEEPRHPSRECSDRRRSQSRRGSRCDDRDLPRRDREDYDDDDDRRGRDDRVSRAISRAPAARSRSRHDSSCGNRDIDRTSRHGDGRSGRRHATPSLASVTSATPSLACVISVAPIALPPLPAPAPEPLLSEEEVTTKLQQMFRDGASNMRAALPVILGIEPPPPSFGTVCRDWLSAIRSAPAELTRGSSRLASAPPVSFMLPAAPLADGAWEGDDGSGTDSPRPLLSGIVDDRVVIDRAVPVCWEQDVAAWSVEDVVVSAPTQLRDLASLGGSPVSPQLAAASRVAPSSPALSPPPGATSPVLDTVVLESALGQGGLAGFLDDADAAGDGGTPSVGDQARRLFCRPEVPLLPRPSLLAPPATIDAPQLRRSARLGAKPAMPTMDRAARVLHLKMGIDMGGEMPLALARKQYEAVYKNVLPDSTIQGLNLLLKLNMPSLVAATDALVALAGPGGTEFAPSADQEVLV